MSFDPLKDIFSGKLSSSDNSQSRLESVDGSQDLFGSQTSSQLDAGIDLRLQLTENIWVQCDNADCQKWRKIPAEYRDSLEDKDWYCSMNPDPRANCCTAPEEDHAQYDKMARRAGIKFVMSALQPGALVWAKMIGYCSWPAVVTTDPHMDMCVWLDRDGDPSSYHVEFLGNPHTHSWVHAKNIEVYGYKKTSKHEVGHSQKSSQSKRKIGKGRGKKLIKSTQTKEKTTFKNSHISSVIAEANFMMKLDPKDRLKYIIFKPKPHQHGASVKGKGPKQKKPTGTCHSCGQSKKTSEKSGVRTKGQSKKSCHVKRLKCDKQQNKLTLDSDKEVELSADEGIFSAPTTASEPLSSIYGFDSPDQLSPSKLKFNNPLNNKTKEEKFTIDINMYRKNEQAFEHDVRRFMTRNGLKIRCMPVWNNVPVKLFQLFLAVYERGGFQKVTENKQWRAVFRELTEQQNVQNGHIAKLYYQKNLLPYELYIRGKDYTSAVTEIRHRRKTTVPSKREIKKPVFLQDTANQSDQTTQKEAEMGNHTEQDENKMFDDSQSKASSTNIDKLLGQLDDDYQAIIFQPDVHLDPKHAIGVKFHDESTESSSQKYSNAVSEFVAPHKQDAKEADNNMDLADVEEKILHEMKALEDDLQEMNKDLENM